MPINDSAGVGVYLIDKSQRASTAIGFRSAGAIEADRGLCNTPTLISSEDDYVKVFGTPSMERHGQAAMEAYMLAQRRVPQVLTRAKNPTFTGNENVFGLAKFSLNGTAVSVHTDIPATSISAPVEENEVLFYFKGEGNYCSKGNDNIVLRFSKPLSQSAYAKEGRPLRVQVFDFNGANHIDEDTAAYLAFNPDVSSVLDDTGKFQLDGYAVDATSTEKVKVTAFVNGIPSATPDEYVYNTRSGSGVYDWIKQSICKVKNPSDPDKSIIADDWLTYYPADNSGSDAGGDLPTDSCYVLISEDSEGKQALNAFNLSVAVTLEVSLPISQIQGGRKVSAGFYGFPCGSVTVSNVDSTGENGVAKFSISTNLYLKNRNEYMFLGDQNEYWASFYQAYCVEDYTFSLSYADYDANYITMQADAVLASSKYLVSKSSDNFNDYTIDYDVDDITTKLHYFEGDIVGNEIGTAQKSHAYSEALQDMLADNLVSWRCAVTPNLGDVMNSGDFVAAITAANETTLGLSNIGRAASVDVFGNGGNNMAGRHGNRFIADYAQYAYRTLAGRRTPVTVASLVADLLNIHYNEGIEARPPFGPTYGQISCTALSQQYSGAERNILARQFKINPVIEDGGFYLWDERTSQDTETSLSDEHSIISFIWMKFSTYDAMKSFVAEYNDSSTVNRGLSVLNQLNELFKAKNYIEEGLPNADKNVLGDEVLRFDYPVRFKGVARYVDIYITAYSQTQTLAISMAEEG